MSVSSSAKWLGNAVYVTGLLQSYSRMPWEASYPVPGRSVLPHRARLPGERPPGAVHPAGSCVGPGGPALLPASAQSGAGTGQPEQGFESGWQGLGSSSAPLPLSSWVHVLVLLCSLVHSPFSPPPFPSPSPPRGRTLADGACGPPSPLPAVPMLFRQTHERPQALTLTGLWPSAPRLCHPADWPWRVLIPGGGSEGGRQTAHPARRAPPLGPPRHPWEHRAFLWVLHAASRPP